jgi:hypothetical protein
MCKACVRNGCPPPLRDMGECQAAHRARQVYIRENGNGFVLEERDAYRQMVTVGCIAIYFNQSAAKGCPAGRDAYEIATGYIANVT